MKYSSFIKLTIFVTTIIGLPESHEHTDFVHLGLSRLLVVQSHLAASAPVPLQHLESDGKVFMCNVKIYSASAYL